METTACTAALHRAAKRRAQAARLLLGFDPGDPARHTWRSLGFSCDSWELGFEFGCVADLKHYVFEFALAINRLGNVERGELVAFINCWIIVAEPKRQRFILFSVRCGAESAEVAERGREKRGFQFRYLCYGRHTRFLEK